MSATTEQVAPQAVAHTEDDELHHDVFVSYSHLDVEFARRLRAALRERGKDVWMDETNIAAAARWARELELAIEASDAFLFLISSSSLAVLVARTSSSDGSWHVARWQSRA